MEKIPTAEEFLFGKADSFDHQMRELTFTDAKVKSLIIEFAKLHVEAALKHASELAEISNKPKFPGDYNLVIDEDSILSSYPLENIE